jgi:hypothetical protein
MGDLQASVESARKGRTRGIESGLCHRVVLLLKDERDDIVRVGRLVLMARQEAHETFIWATYHERRVVLDKSIGTTRHYFDLGSVCGQRGQKAKQGREREKFGEHGKMCSWRGGKELIAKRN